MKNPAPIPINIFEEIFRNLYLVNLKIFKITAEKKINDSTYITMRFCKVISINRTEIIMVINIVG